MLKKVKISDYTDLGKVLGGDLSRNLLRGVFKILIVGVFAPAALGVIRSIYSFFKLVTSFADLGLHYATVTFVAAAIKSGDAAEKNRVLKTVVLVKMLVAVAVVLIGNALAPWITRIVFSDADLVLYVRLAFFAVGGQLLWRFISSYLSAHQQFGRMAAFLITMPLIMLTTAVVLILLDALTLRAGIMIYLFTPAAAAGIWWLIIDRSFLSSRGWDGALVGRFIRFSRWVLLSDVVSSSRNHLNPLLLKNAHLSGSVAQGELSAGLYSFGNDLANEITTLSQAMLTVLLPRASGKTTPRQLRGFARKAYLHVLALIVPLAALVFLARPFILMLGHIKPSYLEYLPSLNVFAILYIATLFNIIALPMHTVLYALRLPQVETTVGVVGLVIMVVGGIVLIPRLGAEGAAVMILVQRVMRCFAVVGFGAYKLSRLKGDTL